MIQEVLLALGVVGAITYLYIRFKPGKKTSDCGENCGCEPKNLNPHDASF